VVLVRVGAANGQPRCLFVTDTQRCPATATARIAVPRRALTALTAATALLLLAGCSDQALIDRVAQVESSQDRLRDSLQDLGAPDPDAVATREAAAAEVAVVADALVDVQAALDALQADIAAQGLEVDDRVTAIELRAEELRAQLVQLSSDQTALTDRISSLEAQFGAHRSDPFGHGG
jgi:hypothetical protein